MKKNTSGLYKITNKINGKVYYGSAVNLAKRWRQHKSDLRRGAHRNPHLQNAWNKHGENAFDFSVFAYCAKENLLENEQILLDLYVGEEDCYNIAPNANSPFLGRKHTEETRTKIAEARKGEKHPAYGTSLSDEHKRKIAEALKGEKNHFYGKTHSDETRRKISEANTGKTGRKHTEETKLKLSQALKGRTFSDEAKMKMSKNNVAHRKIECPYCDKTGDLGNMRRWHFDNCKQKD